MLAGRAELKSSLGRPRRKRITLMDFKETGWKDVNWINLTQNGVQWQGSTTQE
jgi:hypothetical protein